MSGAQQPPRGRVVGVLGAGAGGAGLIGLALALATLEIMRFEGKRNDPYRDIVGVLTVCYGETQGPMRHYSDAECATMLQGRVEADYARPILQCVPQFADRPYPYAASISLSYNIGVRAFCGSTAAKRFRAGQWRAGCDALLSWNRAGGKVVRGLVRRREAERVLCLKGA